MENNHNDKGEAVFNQAYYQQDRLNELFRNVDSMSMILFKMNNIMPAWNYELVYAELDSIASSIPGNISPEEIKMLEGISLTIRLVIRNHPPFVYRKFTGYGKPKVDRTPNYINQDKITDLLKLYRRQIAQVMAKHGMGNPTKQDVTKSVVNM